MSPAVDGAPTPTVPAMHREASIEGACAAVRSALRCLLFTVPTRGPDGAAARMRDQSCGPIVAALELWEDWAAGAKTGSVGNALSSGHVASRQASEMRCSPEAPMECADSGTIAMIHEAIATTIAKAVGALPHESSPTGAPKPKLIFRAPGSASSFALEWQPDGLAMKVLRTRHAVDR